MEPLTGLDYYNSMTSLVSGFQMDSVLFFQMLNTARVIRQGQRPWKWLQKFDTTQIAIPAAAPITAPPTTNKLVLPADFSYLTEDGEITLYDQNNTWQTFTEVPQNLLVPYLQVNNKFYIDHMNFFYYLLGVVDRQYTVFMNYQAELGDIAAATTWQNIPSRFHMILAYDAAAMYRLGVDYDDINARNADANAQAAERLYNAMCAIDDNLQRSAQTRLDRPTINNDSEANFNHKINMGS